jgi:hypothetical protein
MVDALLDGISRILSVAIREVESEGFAELISEVDLEHVRSCQVILICLRGVPCLGKSTCRNGLLPLKVKTTAYWMYFDKIVLKHYALNVSYSKVEAK